MGDNFNLVLEKIFGINPDSDNDEILKKLDNEIKSEKRINTFVHKNEDENEIVINFSPDENTNKITNLCIAAGLPNDDFDRAEKIYKSIVKEAGNDYNYTLQGVANTGSYAQYAGIMAEGSVNNQQVLTYNSYGLKSFTEFNGNEFLGYKIGILYYLNGAFSKNLGSIQIYNELVNEGVINKGNISGRYRSGDTIKTSNMKAVIFKILNRLLELDESEVEELVENHFNPLIVERKMRFIDKYQQYLNNNGDYLINYIMSYNIPARLFPHIGSSYFVDASLKQSESGISPALMNRIEELEEDRLDSLINPHYECFQPYVLLKAGANGETALNRSGSKPQIGNICSNVSLDYLKALVKDIVLDLEKKDKDILKKLFRYHRIQGSSAMLEVIKDRLRYSMFLQKKTAEYNLYKSEYFKENRDLFNENDKIYLLDEAVLEQLESRMSKEELNQLYQWELTGEGIFLILCGKEESEDENSGKQDDSIIEYHGSDSKQKFDNSEERLKLESNEPSRNRIYGSSRQGRYIEELDNEYLLKDEDAYQFNNSQGAGFEILSENTSPERKIKIDGRDISIEY
ncbi:MAG: hypothetical protein GX175_00410, partial [Halanaerobiaceae bacterium]|nr:hypothetical protein [Halanaerobiaceae bacterium]